MLSLILFAGLWCLGLDPSSDIYNLPTLNLTEWRTRLLALPPVPSLSSVLFFPSLSAMPFFITKPGSQKEPITPPATSQVSL